MKEGGMEYAVENCRKSQKMSSGKYHHLLPLRELVSGPFHVETPLFTDDICSKLSAHSRGADRTNIDRAWSEIGAGILKEV